MNDVAIVNTLYSLVLALMGSLSAILIQAMPLTGSPVVDVLINAGALAALIFVIYKVARYQTDRLAEAKEENKKLRLKVEEDLRIRLQKEKEENEELRKRLEDKN